MAAGPDGPSDRSVALPHRAPLNKRSISVDRQDLDAARDNIKEPETAVGLRARVSWRPTYCNARASVAVVVAAFAASDPCRNALLLTLTSTDARRRRSARTSADAFVRRSSRVPGLMS